MPQVWRFAFSALTGVLFRKMPRLHDMQAPVSAPENFPTYSLFLRGHVGAFAVMFWSHTGGGMRVLTLAISEQVHAAGPVPAPRGGHATISVGSKVIIYGGTDRQATPFTDLWVLETGEYFSKRVIISWVVFDPACIKLSYHISQIPTESPMLGAAGGHYLWTPIDSTSTSGCGKGVMCEHERRPK